MSKKENEGCPLCQSRKAKRYCPAKRGAICAVCCGTKREIEIDCPSDCSYLQSGRDYESQKASRAVSVLPTTERLWASEFLSSHSGILYGLWNAVLDERSRFPEMVDNDLQQAVQGLIQTYQTLDNGIYYDVEPVSPIPKSLYWAMKSFFEPSVDSKAEPRRFKTSTILDILTLFLEMELTTTLPRPRSRAFLDHIDKACRNLETTENDSPRLVLP
jgi:hypothetical protein